MAYYIAAASESGIYVDSHFGHAHTYYIIEVDEENGSHRPVEVRHIDVNADEGYESGCFGHSEAVVNAIAGQLEDCKYILVEKIGPRPHKILKRHGFEILEADFAIEEAANKIINYNKRLELLKYSV